LPAFFTDNLPLEANPVAAGQSLQTLRILLTRNTFLPPLFAIPVSTPQTGATVTVFETSTARFLQLQAPTVTANQRPLTIVVAPAPFLLLLLAGGAEENENSDRYPA